MNIQTYTITVESENKPGVLYRIAGIFVRRKINVESLSVAETKTKGLSKFSIIANITPYNAKRVIESIKKIVEVTDVNAVIKK
ncbi:MAG: ACT domain-containing protein [Candidatus Levyibacteriota bacterium]|nr:MAG: ACT domain-containing protein [Candidatus Levybacteria bacterium]